MRLLVGCVTRQGSWSLRRVTSLAHASTQEPCFVPRRGMLDVPYEVVEHVFWLGYARRRELNSRWGRMGCFRQALLALVHLRKNETLSQVAAGFDISTAPAGR
ncbi:transposase family protein [Streptomyces alkaliterrae]